MRLFEYMLLLLYIQRKKICSCLNSARNKDDVQRGDVEENNWYICVLLPNTWKMVEIVSSLLIFNQILGCTNEFFFFFCFNLYLKFEFVLLIFRFFLLEPECSTSTIYKG